MSSIVKVINCAICGKEIETKTHNRKYCEDCSIIVRNKRTPVKVVNPVREAQCLNCKKSYTVTQEWRSPDFCCNTCKTNYYWKRKFGKPDPEKTLDDWVREADACGLDYGAYRGMIEHCGKNI